MTAIRFHSLLLSLLLLTPGIAAQTPACPEVEMQVERLPDLNVPRMGHSSFNTNGEIIVIGGHTSGYVPIKTAEYFSGGKWHVVETAYEHDNACAIKVSDGRILVMGGSEKPLGIGQTYTAEFYDPGSHSFSGFGSLERKRAMATACEAGGGHVVIAGNWYAPDALEVFDGKEQFHFVKDLPLGHAQPYILRTAEDNVMILGSVDTYGKRCDTSLIFRLKGETLDVPLLKYWHPMTSTMVLDSRNLFIGDETEGIYSYLLPVTDNEGQLAIARTEGEDMELLPTVCPIPMSSLDGGRIDYFCSMIVDRKAQRAYFTGLDSLRYCVAAIDYAPALEPGGKALVTLYCSDPTGSRCVSNVVLTDEGDLMLIGGSGQTSSYKFNFEPQAGVLLFRVGSGERASNGMATWLWYALAGLALVIIPAWRKISRTRGQHVLQEHDPKPKDTAALMRRISELMEKEKPYLRSDLKLSDIAASLGAGSRSVSECIREETGLSFSSYINSCRVEYAKELLTRDEGIKIAAIVQMSGFANETSFFRTFKSLTGTTPKEWLKSHR